MTNVDIKELLLSGKNRLDVCNPFVYKQYKHFYSVGACISPSIKKWYHRLVSALGNLGKRKNGASGHPESLFFKILRLRDSPKVCFSDFEASGHPESLFFKISRLRGIPKAYFSRF